ncbi:MAG TPA: hypothetical protein VGS41_05990 [Chthonomonadales bacterium]|nr:hypothetical protein [Chthonomonadales bacterium]
MAERIPPASAPTNTISWWSWRTGMSPIRAVLTGLLLLLLAVFLILVGGETLVSGFIDSSSLHHTSNAPGSLILFVGGLLLLPYTLYLTFGGWHDLRGQRRMVVGKVIALRTTARNVLRQGRPVRPGLASGIARAWYGMALQPSEPREPVMIFRLSEEHFRDLREGEFVQVSYTFHLHHVLSLRPTDAI